MNKIYNKKYNKSYNKKYKKKDIICCNCNKKGHVYKKCYNPITSLGIICFKKDNLRSIIPYLCKNKWVDFSPSLNENINFSNHFKFLLVRRKDSLSFSELVRVKYNISDVEYIKKLLKNISVDEYNLLLKTTNPDDLWNRLWVYKKKSKTRLNEYKRVKNKLNLILNGAIDQNGNLFTLKSLLKNIKPNVNNPEWGFPKGRRIPREKDVRCAIREFCEETDIDKFDINILKNIGPFEEVFIGSNNIVYKHIYFLAEVKNNINLKINKNNIHQISEISDIQFFTTKETIQKIEKKNKKRIEIVIKIAEYLNNII